MERKMLIVEDDIQLLDTIKNYFALSYGIEEATDGLSGIIKAVQNKPDVIILSCHLPKLSGIEVCQQVRQYSEAPILMIGHAMSEDEVVRCFDAGADDFVQRPFGCREIEARINVHARRKLVTEPQPEVQNVITFNGLSINKLTHKAYAGQEEIILTRKEFAILWMLIKNQNEVVTRKDLIRVIWGYEHLDDDRMIDTHLNRIRKKLHKHSQTASITTIWGVGYKIEKRSMFILPELPRKEEREYALAES